MNNEFENNNYDEEIEEQIGDVQRVLDDDFFDGLEEDEYNYKIKEIIKKVLEEKNNK